MASNVVNDTKLRRVASCKWKRDQAGFPVLQNVVHQAEWQFSTGDALLAESSLAKNAPSTSHFPRMPTMMGRFTTSSSKTVNGLVTSLFLTGQKVKS